MSLFIGLFPGFGGALADEPVLAFSLGAAHHNRNGTAVDLDEGGRFNALQGRFLAAVTTGPARLQFDLLADTNENHDVAEFDDDFSGRHIQATIQAGYAPGPWYGGVFLSANRAWFNANSEDQNASSLGFGVSAAYHAPSWSLYGTLGRYEQLGLVDDFETLADIEMISLGGRYFFSENQSLGLDLAYADARSDFDTAIPDDIDIFEVSVSYEHGLNRQIFGGDASIYVEASRFFIDELVLTGAGSATNREGRVELGLRVSFGAASVQDRFQSTSHGVPNVGRWQGITPTVD